VPATSWTCCYYLVCASLYWKERSGTAVVVQGLFLSSKCLVTATRCNIAVYYPITCYLSPFTV
jgi:hypothetical protein